MIEGAEQVFDGRDPFFTDMDILRMINGRRFDMNRIINDLYYHLQWRQTNFPMPRLTDKTLKLLNSGCMYIFGRTKDY